MMEARSLAVLLLSTLAACAGTRSLPSGEVLIQPLPLPESHWAEYTKADGTVRQRQWRRNDEPDHTFSALAALGEPGDVAAYHEFIESKAKQECSRYRTEVLLPKTQGPYPTLVWLTRCRLEPGREQTVLHLAIAGHDSFYTFRRVWPTEPSPQALNAWQRYFETIQVCDSRDSMVPCPEGFTNVVPEAG